jgi:hypothetical protein
MIKRKQCSHGGMMIGIAALLVGGAPISLHTSLPAHAAPAIPPPPPRIITISGQVLNVPTGAARQPVGGASVLASYTICSSRSGCRQDQASTVTDSQGHYSFTLPALLGASITGSVVAGSPMLMPQAHGFRTVGASVTLDFSLLYRYTCMLPSGSTVLLTRMQNTTVEALPGAQLVTANGSTLQCRLSTADPYYQAINGAMINIFQVPAFPDLNFVHNGLQGSQPVYGTWVY